MAEKSSSWEYTPPSVGTIEVDGKVYNASPRGPGNVHFLKNEYYGEGFRQGTFGEQFNLVHSAYLNQKKNGARGIVNVVKNHWASGDTALLGRKDDILVMNNLEIRNGRIYMNSDKLEDLLSQSTELYEGVKISSCGNIGRISRKIIKKGYNKSPTEIKDSLHPYVAFLTLDSGSPPKIDKILEITEKPAYIWVPSDGVVGVPGLGEGDGRLDLFVWGGFGGGRCSFGVRK